MLQFTSKPLQVVSNVRFGPALLHSDLSRFLARRGLRVGETPGEANFSRYFCSYEVSLSNYLLGIILFFEMAFLTSYKFRAYSGYQP
jgi:hypothetical protein